MIPQTDIDIYNEKRKKTKTVFYQFFVTGAFFSSSILFINMIFHFYNDIFSFIPILLGWYMSDLYFGLVHIYLDNVKINKIRNLFEETVYSFQYSHHINPKAFINNVIIFACSGEFIIIVCSWLNMLLFYMVLPSSCDNEIKLVITTMYFGISIGQVAHGLAHMNYNELNIVVKCLQKSKIIINNEQHKRHHIKGMLDYGLVNGWSNPLTNYLFIHYIQKFMAKHPTYFIPQELIVK
jgi:hypothetical protein